MQQAQTLKTLSSLSLSTISICVKLQEYKVTWKVFFYKVDNGGVPDFHSFKV